METLNESFPQGTDSGSSPRCQDTILGGAEAQIRFEAASKQSNDPPLSRVNTLGSVKMAPKRTSTSAAPAMTQAVIGQLVANSVAAALKVFIGELPHSIKGTVTASKP
ncbi:hypothetical protein Tco_1385380 [Tanacetum coccineum]